MFNFILEMERILERDGKDAKLKRRRKRRRRRQHRYSFICFHDND